MTAIEGITLINKPVGPSSFFLILLLRKRLQVQKIGHAGTLDPFASGLMILLIGRNYTRLQKQFMEEHKEYTTRIILGAATTTFDKEGEITNTSSQQPSLEEIHQALQSFQGYISQVPPMYSAKKWKGKKLYELARQGLEVEREPKRVFVSITLLSYTYPYLDLHITCSSGTYIRSIGNDLGQNLGCYAHLKELTRIRSGQFHIDKCLSIKDLANENFPLERYIFRDTSQCLSNGRI